MLFEIAAKNNLECKRRNLAQDTPRTHRNPLRYEQSIRLLKRVDDLHLRSERMVRRADSQTRQAAPRTQRADCRARQANFRSGQAERIYLSAKTCATFVRGRELDER